MTFTVSFNLQFGLEYQRYPKQERDAVNSFVVLYMQHGLGDQTKYPGRITPSWLNLPTNDPNYQFAIDNALWHYHVGVPTYSGVQAFNRTSDWVLHFQWFNRGSHIDLADLYQHYTVSGAFYLPPSQNLVGAPVASPAPTPDPADPSAS